MKVFSSCLWRVGKYTTPIDTRKGLKFSDIHIDRGMVKEEVGQ